jgi:hypothetical protein
MAVTITAQQGDNLFLIDAGGDGDLKQVRVYDLLLDTLGDPLLEGTLRAHVPGWVDPTAIPSVLDYVRQQVATKLRASAPPG